MDVQMYSVEWYLMKYWTLSNITRAIIIFSGIKYLKKNLRLFFLVLS